MGGCTAREDFLEKVGFARGLGDILVFEWVDTNLIK